MAYRGLIAGNQECNYTIAADAGPLTIGKALTSDGDQHVTFSGGTYTPTTVTGVVVKDQGGPVVAGTTLSYYSSNVFGTTNYVIFSVAGFTTLALTNANTRLTLTMPQSIPRPAAQTNFRFYAVINATNNLGWAQVTATGDWVLQFDTAFSANTMAVPPINLVCLCVTVGP